MRTIIWIFMVALIFSMPQIYPFQGSSLVEDNTPAMKDYTDHLPCLDLERILITYISYNFTYPTNKKELIDFYRNRSHYFGNIEDTKGTIRLLRSRKTVLVSNIEGCYLDHGRLYAHIVGNPCTWSRIKYSADNYYYNYSFPIFLDSNGHILYELCLQNLADETNPQSLLHSLATTFKQKNKSIIIDIDSDTNLGKCFFYFEYSNGVLNFLCADCIDQYNFHQLHMDGSIDHKSLSINDIYSLCSDYLCQLSACVEKYCIGNPSVCRIIFRTQLLC